MTISSTRWQALAALASAAAVVWVGCGGEQHPVAERIEPPYTDARFADAGDESAARCRHADVVARCHDGQCLLPSGCFIQGSPATEPGRARYHEELRELTLTHSILVDQHEFTQSEWTNLGYPNLAGTRTYPGGGTDCLSPDCPATTMTRVEALEALNQMSVAEGLEPCVELLGCSGKVGVDFVCTGYRQTTASYYACKGYRLPTGAEFEYAARAGTRTAFYSGEFTGVGPEDDPLGCIDVEHLSAYAWYCANSDLITHPVMQKLANGWGLHDVHGNVFEYTIESGSSGPPHDTAPAVDPESTLFPEGWIASRGGNQFMWPAGLRSAATGSESLAFQPEQRKHVGAGFGFRRVRTLSAEQAASW